MIDHEKLKAQIDMEPISSHWEDCCLVHPECALLGLMREAVALRAERDTALQKVEQMKAGLGAVLDVLAKNGGEGMAEFERLKKEHSV